MMTSNFEAPHNATNFGPVWLSVLVPASGLRQGVAYGWPYAPWGLAAMD